MDPFSIFAIVTAISAAFQAFQSYSQGQAAAAAAEAQAEQEAENAKIAQQQANAAKDQGEAQKDAVRLKMAEMRAQGRVGYAAGNVALGAGTPAEYEVDLAQRAQMDLDTIDTNTNLEAWGHRVQAIDHTNSANALNTQAANSRTAGPWGAAGSLLSGAASVAGGYYLKGAGGLGGSKTNWNNITAQPGPR